MPRFVVVTVLSGLFVWVGVGVLYFASPDNHSPIAETFRTVKGTLFAAHDSIAETGLLSMADARARGTQPGAVFSGFISMLDSLLPTKYTIVDSEEVVQHPQGKIPACSITASPENIDYGGDTTLSWSSVNADRAWLLGIDEVSQNGTYILKGITSTQAYTLTAVGAGGSVSCSAAVNVGAHITVGPSCVISAYPEEIKPGESSSLSWGSQNADSAHLDGIGDVGLKDGITVHPTSTTEYSMTAQTTDGKSVVCTTTVSVIDSQ